MQKTHVDNIITRSVLSNRSQHRLVVRRRVDGRKLVEARGQPVGNISCQDTVVRCAVEPLEERKAQRVQQIRSLKRRDCLDYDVRVANDHTVVVERLRGREVFVLGVHKVTSLKGCVISFS